MWSLSKQTFALWPPWWEQSASSCQERDVTLCSPTPLRWCCVVLVLSDLRWISSGVIFRLPMCSRFEFLFWSTSCSGLCPRQRLAAPLPRSSRKQRRAGCLPSPWRTAVTHSGLTHRCREGSESTSRGCFSGGHRGRVCPCPCPWVALPHPCPNGQHLAVSCPGPTGPGRLPWLVQTPRSPSSTTSFSTRM